MIIQAVASGNPDLACTLIQQHSFPYDLVRFTDVRNDNQTYWMLAEVLPVTVGWGTYVIRSEEVAHEIVVEVPHPVADWRTDPEGVEIFRQLGARALLIAGADRCANTAYSTCNGLTIAYGESEPYRQSDVAHAPQTMFQAAHRALVACSNETVAIQLHGNSLGTCNGTFTPGSLTTRLYENAARRCDLLEVDLADSSSTCSFNGGDSIQALFTNGCGRTGSQETCVVYTGAPSIPERFIFLEQSTALRQDYGCLINAIQQTFDQHDEE